MPDTCVHAVSLSDPCVECQKVSEVNEGGFAPVRRRCLANPCTTPEKCVMYGCQDDDSGIPSNPDATVHVECALCENLIEVRTGCAGIDDALSQGWSLDASNELICTSCTEARAEMIGDER